MEITTVNTVEDVTTMWIIAGLTVEINEMGDTTTGTDNRK